MFTNIFQRKQKTYEAFQKAQQSAYDKKFAKVMREFEKGNLKSGSGKVVTERKQAQAIAHSEASKA